MKHLSKNNKGVTLIELISAIAILAIVAISVFTLLMFSIRSHNFIMSGSSSAQDAELLNKRLEIIFSEAEFPSAEGEIDLNAIVLSDNKKLSFSEDGLLLQDTTQENELEIIQDNLSSFEIHRVTNTKIVRVSYTIGDRNFVKLFRVKFESKETSSAS